MNSESYSEKVSVNINTATLSSIDLLVDHGYYSNRSDFINQALRQLLQENSNNLDRLISQENRVKENGNNWFMGIFVLTCDDLLKVQRENRTITVSGYGILKIADDIEEELIFSTISKIDVKGKVFTSDAIKAHYHLK